LTVFQALLLGIIQGLTEFLPVSSSGHLEIAHSILGVENHDNLLFALVVHGATVLSTILVFRKDMWKLASAFFRFKWNGQTKYVVKIFLSMVPVVIIGLFFKDRLEYLFDGQIVFVGFMLLLTGVLLLLTVFVKKGEKEISYSKALIIGIAQAFAVLPGLSRSGATISTGILLGIKKEAVARFSFLMVIIPIIGAVIFDVANGKLNSQASIGLTPLIVGFLAAFITGVMACKWMISIVKRGKLIYFAIYCFIIGLIAIFAA
jgi:undecaprenyl-diphosphatase